MPSLINKKQEKEKILCSAMKCFTSLGYSNTTMDYIAESYGKSKACIYQYFPSKKSLFLALTEYWLEDFKKRIIPIMESSDDPKLIFADITREIASNIQRDIPFFKAQIEFLHYSYLDKQIQKRIQKIYKFWTEKIKDCLLKKGNDDDRCYKLAIFIIALFDGIILRKTAADDINIVEIINFMKEILLRILDEEVMKK